MYHIICKENNICLYENYIINKKNILENNKFDTNVILFFYELLFLCNLLYFLSKNNFYIENQYRFYLKK